MEYLEGHRRSGATELARAELTSARPARRHRSAVGLAVPPVIVVLLLLVWQVASMRGAIDSLHFPAPTTIARATWTALVDGSLLSELGATAVRIAWAVGTGGLLGMAVGVAMGLSEWVRRVLDPFVGALHPLPKIAMLPLMLVVLGIGELPLIVIIAAGVFFPMLINTMAGVSQIDPIHRDVARLYGAGRWLVMHRVVVPAAALSVLAGLRLSLNTALLIAVAVEMVAADSGLGDMIWMSWTTFRIENIYVAMFATIAFGLCVNLLISLLTRVLVPWRQKES